MIEIQIDCSEAINALQSYKNKIKNKTPLMASIADEMHTAVIRNFEAEGRPNRWRALAPATIAFRKRNDLADKPILENYGTLNTRFESQYGDNFAILTTNTPYARIHQFGGVAGRKSPTKNPKRKRKEAFSFRRPYIPARPFLVVTDTEIKDIENLVVDYLNDD